ncbi:hypothetical protein K466DRAFT_606277 [Polyporus arcularius HHB13444]|uniref:Uncharacterized protein n=1 Tax=Polyporus arcularius HHB13444 TaxID=1314778 RepID=A0A5C3NR87_9APHY|nr:hypothetical protein K466DRAFT_606277 [Polyporus arcularius HHB13444]
MSDTDQSAGQSTSPSGGEAENYQVRSFEPISMKLEEQQQMELKKKWENGETLRLYLPEVIQGWQRYDEFHTTEEFREFDEFRKSVEDRGRASDVEELSLHFDMQADDTRGEDAMKHGLAVLSFLDTLGKANLHTLRLGNLQFASFLIDIAAMNKTLEERVKTWKRLETLVISCNRSTSHSGLWKMCKTYGNSATIRHLRIDSFAFPRWNFAYVPMDKTLCQNLVSFKLSLRRFSVEINPIEMHEFWPCGWLTLKGTMFGNLTDLEIDESQCRIKFEDGSTDASGILKWELNCPNLLNLTWILSADHLRLLEKSLGLDPEAPFTMFKEESFNHFTRLKHLKCIDITKAKNEQPSWLSGDRTTSSTQS